MKKWMQFIKFGLVGISNTLISEGIYVVVVCLRGHYVLANFLGFVISVLNAYYWGNKYVFKEQEDKEKRVWWKTLLKTYVAYSGGFLLELLFLFLFVDLLNISQYMNPLVELVHRIGLTGLDAQVVGELLAKALTIVVVVPVNYLVNKYWAYRQKDKSTSGEEE